MSGLKSKCQTLYKITSNQRRQSHRDPPLDAISSRLFVCACQIKYRTSPSHDLERGGGFSGSSPNVNMHVNKSVSFQIDIKTKRGGIQRTTWSFERKFIFVGLCMITRHPGEQMQALRLRGRRSQPPGDETPDGFFESGKSQLKVNG